MRLYRWSTIFFLITALAIIPGVTGSSIGGGMSAAGTSSGVLIANAEGATGEVSGYGDFSGNWRVENTAGTYAEVGMNIIGSESYSYACTLKPGEGEGWSSSEYPKVSAGEVLDVNNANYIKAYALSGNANGYSSDVSTMLARYDEEGNLEGGNHWDLLGYENIATANTDKVIAAQKVSGFGPQTTIALATDELGREAKSIANCHIFPTNSLDQYALLDDNSVLSWQSLTGSAYFYFGRPFEETDEYNGEITTSAKDDKGNEAVSSEKGSFSGNMVSNWLQASVDFSKVSASQKFELEYEPFSYETGTYDQKIIGKFSTSTHDSTGRVAESVQNIVRGEYVQSSIGCDLR
jgi:hypothetical protein